MKKNMKKNKSLKPLVIALALFVGLGLLFGLSALGAFMHFNSPPPLSGAALARGGDAPVYIYAGLSGVEAEDDGLGIRRMPGGFYVDVRPGESSQSVGRRLEAAGLIRSSRFWDLAARLSGDFIRAGTFFVAAPSSQLEIRSVLVAGRQVMLRVTIPEGATIRRAAIILEEAGIVPAADFIQAAADPQILAYFDIPNESMEGFLFPDTYLFPAGYPAERVVRAMAENFFARLYENFPSAMGLSREELNQVVILASIVEREYRVPQEAAVMAGVFANRLRIGMMLQSCATVEYVITEILGLPHPTRLFYRDLAIPSPFNTYLVRGLPPAPISAPGVISLNAALYPAETEYLFFRLINAQVGNHHFSRTLDEHNRAGPLIAAGLL
ncbi:MAG: endolytic transglycosylase MltG [Spirochaetes bacterium]|nr:endolytic transglycosylase MltG [Spirochaetota bacterium]